MAIKLEDYLRMLSLKSGAIVPIKHNGSEADTSSSLSLGNLHPNFGKGITLLHSPKNFMSSNKPSEPAISGPSFFSSVQDYSSSENTLSTSSGSSDTSSNTKSSDDINMNLNIPNHKCLYGASSKKVESIDGIKEKLEKCEKQLQDLLTDRKDLRKHLKLVEKDIDEVNMKILELEAQYMHKSFH